MIHDSSNVYAPCIYRINTFLKSGLPLISDRKGDKIIVNAEAAKTITMQLVDHHVIKTATRVKDPIGHLNGKTIQKPISQHQFFQHDKFDHFHRVISCWLI